MRYKSLDDLPARYRKQAIQQVQRESHAPLEGIVPISLHSANTLLRMNHWRRKQYRQQCYHALAEAGFVALTPPDFKVHLSLIRILGPRQRLFDADNAVAAFKVFIDAMRDARLLKDDDPQHLDLAPVTQDDARRERGPAVFFSLERAQ